MRSVEFENPQQEKELIQLLILSALSENPLAKKVTFHGGTALRFCYHGNRYSNDLDFASAEALDHQQIERFAEKLRKMFHRDLQNDVRVVVDPFNEENIVHKIAVGIIPKERDKLYNKVLLDFSEHIPARTPVSRFAQSSFFPDLRVYATVETMEEILADKLVAFAARTISWRSFKARDVWDIDWLEQTLVHKEPVLDLLVAKLQDYKISSESFIQLSQQKVESLQTDQGKKTFTTEMRKYLDENLRWICDDDKAVRELLDRVKAVVLRFTEQIEVTSRVVEQEKGDER